jgi:Flp pilus assembly protein CpaB
VENIMSSKLFTTRQGTILLGVIAAIIAAIALIVYLNHYRGGAANTTQVLVAERLIQKGTEGDVIRTTAGIYKLTPFAKDQVKAGAIADPAELAGKVTLTDIAGGQQMTASDFGPAADSVATQLHRNERAVVIPLGSPQTVDGQIAGGSHVDVWVAMNGANHLLFQNMYVLGLNGENATLEATNPQEAGTLIQASQTAQIWLVLRPTVGTVLRRPPAVTSKNLTVR